MKTLKESQKKPDKKPFVCIIKPNSKWKLRWDVYIMVNMIAAALLTPWQLAFVEEESLTWVIINSVIDSAFLIDIIVTFFTAYFDEKAMCLVVDRKVIA